RALSAPPSEVDARLAVSFPYQPSAGDRVLVIANADGIFVIGVLATTRTEGKLAFAGDFEVAATGKLRLHGLEGVEVVGAEVAVRAGKLEMFARQVTTRYDELRQRVV